MALSTASPSVAILNGDAIFELSLRDLFQYHSELETDLTMSVKPMVDATRYGNLELSDGRVCSFSQGSSEGLGYINAGVYIVNTRIFNDMSFPECFSFEKDFLEREVGTLQSGAFVSDGYFIDIGVPEDLQRARLEL